MAGAKVVGTVVWMALLLAAFAAVTERTRVYGERSYDLLSRPPLAHLDTHVLDVVTLGHRGLWDDIAAIWTIQILMDKRLASFPVEDINRAVTDVTHHHPHIENLYLLGCYVIGMDLKHPENCERLIQDGLAAFPDSWRLPLTEGLIAIEYLHDPKSAAVYYAMAASRPGAPDFLRSYANKIVDKNALDPGEIRQTLDQLFGSGAGTRVGSILEESLKRREAVP